MRNEKSSVKVAGIGKMSKVAICKVGEGDECIEKATRRAMKLCNWRRYVKGEKLVLKPNLVWDLLYPGVDTNPGVIRGVLQEVTKYFNDVTIVEANTAAGAYADRGFRNLGIDKLAAEFNAKCVSLGKDKYQKIRNNGYAIKVLDVPQTLLDADCIITIPVLKTHMITGITCSIKNQWGCIHELRHNYHLHIDKALFDVNNFLKEKLKFAVLDATICLEGMGPKLGVPRELGYVFASNDLVSMDAAAATVMGFDPKEIGHLVFCNEKGLGDINFHIVGDALPRENFKRARKNIVIGSEFFFRKLGLEKLFFKTPLFELLRRAAQIYNTTWYILEGRTRRDRMLKTRYGTYWKKYARKRQELWTKFGDFYI